MTKIILTIFSILFILGCSNHSKEVQASDLYRSDKLEFSFLDKHIKDKKIVAIGESSHGIGDFYALKSKLVNHLYNDLGFEIIAMEGGFGDLNLAWIDVDKLSSKELRNKTVFRNFHCEEIEPLFNLIKDNSKTEVPLIYSGFDCHTSSSYFLNEIDTILKLGNEKLSEQLKDGLAAYNNIFPSAYEEDSTIFILNRDQFLSSLGAVINFVKDNKSLIQSAYQYSAIQMEIINRSLEGLWKSMDIEYSNRFSEEGIFSGIVLRDELMFENLKWIIEERYPNKKVIIWGHNAHIQKGKLSGNNTKWMGQLLKEEFGDQYYSLGLFAYKGNTYQHWTKEAIPFENLDSTSIECILNSSGESKYAFQNLNDQKINQAPEWMFNEVSALEIENGGMIRFIPVERFDGVLTLYEVSIPKFNN